MRRSKAAAHRRQRFSKRRKLVRPYPDMYGIGLARRSAIVCSYCPHHVMPRRQQFERYTMSRTRTRSDANRLVGRQEEISLSHEKLDLLDAVGGVGCVG